MEATMVLNSRRDFLAEVGRGMLLAGLGTALATDLEIAPAWAIDEANSSLQFGPLEPLAVLMQETPPALLTSKLVDRLKHGADLRTLTAAGALANARTFGGEDYVGYHTFMALAPAYRMAQALPVNLQPLPVLKVLYRNANRIQEFGGRKSEVLHPVNAQEALPRTAAGEQLRDASRKGDVDAAERTFAAIMKGPVGEAFNHLQYAVEDEVDVHRVVLCWRGWDTLDIAGQEWAHTLLRQSVRYCATTERHMIDRGQSLGAIRTVLPKLMDQYNLADLTPGKNSGDDAWIDELAATIFRGSRDQAANAAAQSLRDGYSPEAIGEAISIAANMLVLHDPGRPEQWANADKPLGSCHGDSVGVHASDAANAWRNIVRISNPRNVVAGLIVAAFHTAGQSERSNQEAYPSPEHLREIRGKDAGELLAEAENAIRSSDQFRAAAAVARYGQLGFDPRAAFSLLLKFATSEDGALHAEKYYQTASAEFATIRPAFRWRQLVALARVTASEYGHRSPGYEEAKRLLGV
jgi:hypothetical protein